MFRSVKSVVAQGPAHKRSNVAGQRVDANTPPAPDGLRYALQLCRRHRHDGSGVICHPGGAFADVQGFSIDGRMVKKDGGYAFDTALAATELGGYLLMRPFIEHQMYSVIVMKGGADTGATYYGHNSVTVGDDAVSKMHYANFTFYQKALVRQPKNVFVAEDIFAAGYVGGCNTALFTTAAQVLSPQSLKRPSIIVARLHQDEVNDLPNPLSITGSFTGAMQSQNEPAVTGEVYMHYRSSVAVCSYFDLAKLLHYDSHVNGQYVFTPTNKDINTICFEGASIVRNKGTGGVITKRNTGHWGHTYAGVRAVRSGHNKYMETQARETSLFSGFASTGGGGGAGAIISPP
jgi:hypothetical protein